MKKKISWYYKKILFKIKNKINLDKMKIDTGDLNRLFNHFGSDKGTSAKNQNKKNSKKRIGHGFAKFYKKYSKYYKNNFLIIIKL
jgi:hypothetical protein